MDQFKKKHKWTDDAKKRAHAKFENDKILCKEKQKKKSILLGWVLGVDPKHTHTPLFTY
jgi:hypothetical protein